MTSGNFEKIGVQLAVEGMAQFKADLATGGQAVTKLKARCTKVAPAAQTASTGMTTFGDKIKGAFPASGHFTSLQGTGRRVLGPPGRPARPGWLATRWRPLKNTIKP